MKQCTKLIIIIVTTTKTIIIINDIFPGFVSWVLHKGSAGIL
jgi:hypothetical protein